MIDYSKRMILLVLCFLLIACPDKNNNHEENPWSNIGLEDKSIRTLKAFGDYLYATTYKRGLYRLNLAEETFYWENIWQEDSVYHQHKNDNKGVVDFFVNEDNPNSILISVYEPGYDTLLSIHTVYVTHDNGQSWAPSDNGLVWNNTGQDTESHPLPSQFIESNGSIFAKTIGYSGIYVSENFGESWTVFQQEDWLSVGRFFIHPSNSNYMWQINGDGWGTGHNLLVSDNKGASWTDLWDAFPEMFTTITDLALNPIDPNIAYVTFNESVFRTVNGGGSWFEIVNEDSLNNSGWRYLVTDENNPNWLYIFKTHYIGYEFYYETIKYSENQGENWAYIPIAIEIQVEFPWKPIHCKNSDTFFFPTLNGITRFKRE